MLPEANSPAARSGPVPHGAVSRGANPKNLLTMALRSARLDTVV